MDKLCLDILINHALMLFIYLLIDILMMELSVGDKTIMISYILFMSWHDADSLMFSLVMYCLYHYELFKPQRQT